MHLVFGADGHPALGYLVGQSDLIYAAWDGSAWETDRIDRVTSMRGASLALDDTGSPAFSYHYLARRSTDDKLRYAYKTGSDWMIEIR